MKSHPVHQQPLGFCELKTIKASLSFCKGTLPWGCRKDFLWVNALRLGFPSLSLVHGTLGEARVLRPPLIVVQDNELVSTNVCRAFTPITVTQMTKYMEGAT